jgi:hypothetical protein
VTISPHDLAIGAVGHTWVECPPKGGSIRIQTQVTEEGAEAWAEAPEESGESSEEQTDVKLHVKIVEAVDIAQMDALSKTDAFVTVEVAGVKEQTKEQSDTMTPKWDESFSFDVSDRSGSIVLEMFDQDVSSAEFMGRAEVPLSKFRVGQVLEGWVELPPKGGKLHWFVHVAHADDEPFVETA